MTEVDLWYRCLLNVMYVVFQDQGLGYDGQSSAISEESALQFVGQMMRMGHLLVFDTMMDFSNVEASRKMASGGLIRQCMRLCK